MQPLENNVSDMELARQSQAGSLLCFETLVHRHEARIYRFLLRHCRCEADAQDLTQATFVAAYRALHQYRPEGTFSSWLFAIARRKFIDHYRARQKQEPPAAQEPTDPNDPSVLIAQSEEARNLWGLVQRLLPRDQYDALTLKYREELSVKEIATVLERTQTSVKVLLFRARQTLIRGFANRRISPVAEPTRTASRQAAVNSLEVP